MNENDDDNRERGDEPPNWFKTLNGLNVNEKVEKKNGFSYLSWAWAHARMAELDPDFDWWPEEFDGLPYKAMPGGCMVKVTVRFHSKTRSHLYPVLDNRNKPIAEPSVFDINTSIMRGFVKCCALFGLGLYIYAGEDLPEDEARAKHEAAVAEYAQAWTAVLAQDKDEAGIAADVFDLHNKLNGFGADFYVEVSNRIGSAERSAFKKYVAMHKQGVHKILPNGRAA
jgi:hypothetical protein